MSTEWKEARFRAEGPSPGLRARSALGTDGWVPIRLLELDRPTRDHDSGPGRVGELALAVRSSPPGVTAQVADRSAKEFRVLDLSAEITERVGEAKTENIRIFLGDATELQAGWFTIAARNKAWSLGVARLVYCRPLQRINGGRRLLVDLAHHDGENEDLSVEAMVAAGLMLPYDPFLVHSKLFPNGTHPFMRKGRVDQTIIGQLADNPALQLRIDALEIMMLTAIVNGFGLFGIENWIPPGSWRNDSESDQLPWQRRISVADAKRLLG